MDFKLTSEKLKALEEKHESLFTVELKNIKFFYDQKIQLVRFVEHCIEALFFLYIMWYTHEGLDPKLYQGMTKRSVWFYTHGLLLQRFVDIGWEPNLASTVCESIVEYIVSQAYDLFSIRTGRLKIH